MKSLAEGMNVFKWPFESFKLKRLAVLLFPLFVNVVKTIQVCGGGCRKTYLFLNMGKKHQQERKLASASFGSKKKWAT